MIAAVVVFAVAFAPTLVSTLVPAGCPIVVIVIAAIVIIAIVVVAIVIIIGIIVIMVVVAMVVVLIIIIAGAVVVVMIYGIVIAGMIVVIVFALTGESGTQGRQSATQRSRDHRSSKEADEGGPR